MQGGRRSFGLTLCILLQVLIWVVYGAADTTVTAHLRTEADPLPAASTPEFLPAATAHVLSVTITMSSATAGALIYYTSDGSVPTHTSLSMPSGGSFTWNELGATTFRAIAVKDGYADSNVATKEYSVMGRCGKPTLDPPSGTFVRAVDVKLVSSTDGARIYFTKDMKTPNEASSFIASGETVTLDTPGSVTLRAMAVKDGMANSLIAETTYQIQQQVQTPQFTPLSDSFVLSAQLTMACATEGSTVYYTMDGSTPSRASLSLTPPATIAISDVGTFVIQAFASRSGWVDSEVAKKTVHILARASVPMFSPPGDGATKYISNVPVTLNCGAENATVYYTTGSQTPNAHSPHVKCGHTIILEGDGQIVLRAYATVPGMADSAIAQARYQIVPPAYDETPVNRAPYSVNPDVQIRPIEKTIKACSTCTGRRVRGRVIRLRNPLGHFSMMQPLLGCGNGTFLPSETGRSFAATRKVIRVPKSEDIVALNSPFKSVENQYQRVKDIGCQVVTNAGFFNTASTVCYGHLVTQGKIIQTSPKHNVNFGIRNGSFVVGYLQEDEVRDTVNPFEELTSGALWLVRNGVGYVDRSYKEEDMSIQETGKQFITVQSARTAIGHDAEGNLMILQVEGETWVYGVSLYEFADLAVELGFKNAINLDGGGSATVSQNNSLISDPSWQCGGDTSSLFRCEKEVATITCLHAEPPPLYVHDGDTPDSTVAPTGGGAAITNPPTSAPTLSPTMAPTAAVEPTPKPPPTPAPTHSNTPSPTNPTESNSANTSQGASLERLRGTLDAYQFATASLAMCLLVSLAVHAYPYLRRRAETSANGSTHSGFELMGPRTNSFAVQPSGPTGHTKSSTQYHKLAAYNPMPTQTDQHLTVEDGDESNLTAQHHQRLGRSDDLEGFYSDDDNYFASKSSTPRSMPQRRSRGRRSASPEASDEVVVEFNSPLGWQQMPSSGSATRTRRGRWFTGSQRPQHPNSSQVDAEDELNPFTRSV